MSQIVGLVVLPNDGRPGNSRLLGVPPPGPTGAPEGCEHWSEATKAKRDYRWLGAGECQWGILGPDKEAGRGQGEAWHGRLDVDLSLRAALEG